MIKQAFVLAAGLGTRLRPLTDTLPKPLIPVGLKPLITYAFDHLIADAGIEEFIVNTHHLAEAYTAAFPEGSYRGRRIKFRHEPLLLETGGGIKNIADLLLPDAGPLLVYNGDILTDLPIGPAIAHHQSSGNEVTLVLRSKDGPRHIAWNQENGLLSDIRNLLGTGLPSAHAFSCVYLLEKAFLTRLPVGKVVSVIPSFLEMIREGARLGGIVIDDGRWWDLGNRTEYLRVHRDLRTDATDFPRYGAPDPAWRNWLHPSARVAAGVQVLGGSTIGAGCQVGAGTILEDSILWPGAKIASNSHLENCIVRCSQSAAGEATGRDF